MSTADKTATAPFKGIFRATVSAKRKEGVSKAEFSRRFTLHGKMAGPVILKHNGISYVQHHLFESHAASFKEHLGPEMAQQFVFSDTDGIITLIFPTVKDMAGFFSDPAHEETLNADVADFADASSVKISVGDELQIIWGGELQWTPYVLRQEDDWSAVTDTEDRKRIQNRLAQRARRANLGTKPNAIRGKSAASSHINRNSLASTSDEAGRTIQQMSNDDRVIAESLAEAPSTAGMDASPPLYGSSDMPPPDLDTHFIILTPLATVAAYTFNAVTLQLSCTDTTHLRTFESSESAIPFSLAPTQLQRTIPHPSYVEIIPFPGVRDRLLRSLQIIDQEKLSEDLVQDAFRVWGNAAWDEAGWEVSETFARKWWFLIDDAVLRATNFWRRQRSDGALVMTDNGEVSVVM
ncbi:hypothetical protein FSARC_12022 [Fusarium sarcochroum]|uniref:EthD domain-containing protein n=1 Tax=Fusarium sarcochroum TaxID=1208366 RepID=A0A8H4TB95_9HYPO|nr:hypothetical protein FSARC_12022 [Fusarium sarcochroum]